MLPGPRPKRPGDFRRKNGLSKKLVARSFAAQIQKEMPIALPDKPIKIGAVVDLRIFWATRLYRLDKQARSVEETEQIQSESEKDETVKEEEDAQTIRQQVPEELPAVSENTFAPCVAEIPDEEVEEIDVGAALKEIAKKKKLSAARFRQKLRRANRLGAIRPMRTEVERKPVFTDEEMEEVAFWHDCAVPRCKIHKGDKWRSNWTDCGERLPKSSHNAQLHRGSILPECTWRVFAREEFNKNWCRCGRLRANDPDWGRAPACAGEHCVDNMPTDFAELERSYPWLVKTSLALIDEVAKAAEDTRDFGTFIELICGAEKRAVRECELLVGIETNPGPEEVDTFVAAPGYCWQALPVTNTDGMRKTATEIVEALDECEDCIEELDNYIVKYSIVASGDFHIEDVKRADAFGVCRTSLFTQEEVDKGAELLTGTDITGYILCSKFRDVLANAKTRQVLGDATNAPSTRDVIVGSERLLASAMDVYGPELLKGKAAQQVESWDKSRLCTKYALSTEQKEQVNLYVGTDVGTRQEIVSTSDHVVQQVARDLCRKTIDTLHPREDHIMTLHVGATYQDFHQWKGRPNHHFLFSFSDAKDTSRTITQFTNYVLGKVAEKRLNVGVAGRASITQFGNFVKVVEFYNEHIAKQNQVLIRGYAPHSLKPIYGRLFFSDSLYDISKKEFLDYWRDTGALEAVGVIFSPFAFIDPEMQSESEWYTMETYYDATKTIEKAIEEVWPEVLLLTPIAERAVTALTGSAIGEHIKQFLQMVLSFGWQALKKTFSAIFESKTPIISLANGLLEVLKVDVIGKKLWQRILDIFEEKYARVAIVWKGFQNGYDHQLSTWRNWCTERVFEDESLSVVSETHSSFGEMNVLKFFRNTAQKARVAWSLTIPEHHRNMKILDWNRTWNPRTGTFNLDKEWTFCRQTDFYTLLSWAEAEPEASMELTTVIAAANRVRKGLSLISYTPFRGLQVTDDKCMNFALNVWLTILRKHKLADSIKQRSKELTTSITNIEALAVKVAKTATAIASGGLIFPLVKLINWCLIEKPLFKFVLEPEERPINLRVANAPEMARAASCEIPKELLGLKINVSTPERKEEADACLMCGMCKKGAFGSQKMYTEGACEQPPWEWEMDPTDCAAARQLALEALNNHRAGGLGPQQCASIDHFAKYFDGDISHKGAAKVHYIRGGAGTGKSTVMREIAAYHEDKGLVVGINVPLRALKADFTNAKMLDGTTRSFQCQTPWLMCKYQSLDVLMTDEAGLEDQLHFRALVAYTNPKAVYVIGDHAQQDLTDMVGQGIFMSDWWEAVPKSKHELVYCYRLRQGRVNLINRMYGTHMISVHKNVEEDDLPKFITIEEYANHVKTIDDTEYVFSHGSAERVFGRPSGAGVNMDNLSVYCSQGKTTENSFISCVDTDRAAFGRHGCLYVALTRAKRTVTFVCHDLDNETVNDLKVRMFMDTPENIAETLAWQVPEYEENVEEEPVSLEIRGAERAFPKPTLIDEIGKKSVDPAWTLEEYAKVHWREVLYPCAYDIMPVALKEEFVRLVLVPSIVGLVEDGHVKYEPGNGLIIKTEKWKVSVKALKQFFNEKKRSWITVEHDILTKLRFDGFKWAEDPLPPLQFVIANTHITRIKNADKYVVPVLEPTETRHGVVALPKKRSIMTLDASGQWIGVAWSLRAKSSDYEMPMEAITEARVGWLPPALTRETLATPSIFHRPAIVQSKGEVWTSNEQAVEDAFDRPDLSKRKVRINEHNAFSHWQVLPYMAEGFDVVTGFNSPTHLFQAVPPNRGYPSARVATKNLWFDRTKSGKIGPRKVSRYMQIAPGAGNHFTNSPNSTLNAAGRVLATVAKKPLTPEANKYVEQAAKKAVETNHRPVVLDDTVYNKFNVAALKDGRTKNYDNRATADEASGRRWLDTFGSNKAQDKPVKNQKIDHLKRGQALVTPTSMFNCRHIAPMRSIGAHYKASAREHLHLDTYMRPEVFLRGLQDSVRKLPTSAQCAILDSTEFDAGQGPVTVAAEKHFRRFMGVNKDWMDDYYQIREPTRLFFPGLLKGRTSGQKGSGFPDTYLGNTTLTEIMGTDVFEGIGPQVVAVKGDDYAKWQSQIKVRQSAVDFWNTMTNIKAHWMMFGPGGGGEFCGYILGTHTIAPSLQRMALKAVCKRIDSREKFLEYQQSLRDKLKQIRTLGIQDIIEANASAGEGNVGDNENYWAFLTSLSHVSWDDYKARAMHKSEAKNVRIAGYKGPDLGQF